MNLNSARMKNDPNVIITTFIIFTSIVRCLNLKKKNIYILKNPPFKCFISLKGIKLFIARIAPITAYLLHIFHVYYISFIQIHS